MKIYLATDHAGFSLKGKIKKFLIGAGYEVEDCGAFKLDSGDDYPDFIHKAAKAVSKNPKSSRAIIFGGSGQGEAMVANRYRRVRAAVYYGPASAEAAAGKGSLDIVKLSREHNDTNVISLGARFLTERQALRAVSLWLKTPFSKTKRHARRIKKIDR